jgi:hypothetical protein
METYDGRKRNEPHASAGAKTFDLLEKLNSSVYGSWEISAWEDEESLAWFEALQRHGQIDDALERIEE